MARTTCPVCHGSGQVTEWTDGKHVRVECIECDGLGVVRPDWYITDGARHEIDDANRVRQPGGGK